MTPEELHRLAAQQVAEAEELQADAARLRSQAGALAGLLDPLIAMSQRVWRGPAARKFEGQVRINASRVNEQARTLDRVAADFDRTARHKNQEAARLRAQAAAVESVSPLGGVV